MSASETKDPLKWKYQLINWREKVRVKKLKNPKTFTIDVSMKIWKTIIQQRKEKRR